MTPAWRFLLAAVAVLAACTSTPRPHPADLAFERGAYAEAAAAYEVLLRQSSAVRDSDRILFHAAVAWSLAVPAKPERTVRLCEQLLAEHPASPYRPPAELVLGLHRTLAQIRDDVAERTRIIEALAGDTARMHADYERIAEQKSEEIRQLDAQLAALERRMREQRAGLAERQAEVERLAEELEALKRIDTERSRRRP